MIEDAVILDLARATGHQGELSGSAIRSIRQKLAHSFVDDVLDAQPDPNGSPKVPINCDKEQP